MNLMEFLLSLLDREKPESIKRNSIKRHHFRIVYPA